jgi:hypothetical protein
MRRAAGNAGMRAHGTGDGAAVIVAGAAGIRGRAR